EPMRNPNKLADIGQDLAVAQVMAETYDNPLGFVMLACPWGEPGDLAGFTGPDRRQREFLEELGREVRSRGFDGIRSGIADSHGHHQRARNRQVDAGRL